MMNFDAISTVDLVPLVLSVLLISLMRRTAKNRALDAENEGEVEVPRFAYADYKRHMERIAGNVKRGEERGGALRCSCANYASNVGTDGVSGEILKHCKVFTSDCALGSTGVYRDFNKYYVTGRRMAERVLKGKEFAKGGMYDLFRSWFGGSVFCSSEGFGYCYKMKTLHNSFGNFTECDDVVRGVVDRLKREIKSLKKSNEYATINLNSAMRRCTLDVVHRYMTGRGVHECHSEGEIQAYLDAVDYLRVNAVRVGSGRGRIIHVILRAAEKVFGVGAVISLVFVLDGSFKFFNWIVNYARCNVACIKCLASSLVNPLGPRLPCEKCKAIKMIRICKSFALRSVEMSKSCSRFGKFRNNVIKDVVEGESVTKMVMNLIAKFADPKKPKQSAARSPFITKKSAEEYCVDEMVTLLFAGSDTSSTVITVALLKLCSADMKTFVMRGGGAGDKGSDEHEEEDEVVKYVIEEALRLHPPSPYVARRCVEEAKLYLEGTKKYVVVPRNAVVTVWLQCANLDASKYGNDASEFIPSRRRFHNSNSTKTSSAPSHVSFATGGRQCFGSQIARRVTRDFVKAWRREFRWRFNGDIEVSQGFTNVWRDSGGVEVAFRDGGG